MREQDNYTFTRRDFIKGSLYLSAGAVVVSSAKLDALSHSIAVTDAPDSVGESRGYEVTQHVLDYYRSLAD